MTAASFFVYLFGAVAVAGALAMLVQRNPIFASLSLAVTFLALAGLFAALEAHFLAIIQLIVYTGLIQVLIIYTVMLMDLDESHIQRRRNAARIFGAVAGGVLAIQIVSAAWQGFSPAPQAAAPGFGTTAAVANVLFGPYLLPFEVVSVLLLAGIVGAVVLAKTKPPTRGKTPRSEHPTPIDTESSVHPKLIRR